MTSNPNFKKAMNHFSPSILSRYMMVLLFVSTFTLISCNPECDPANNDPVGGEFFTVTYETSDGTNYLRDIYRSDKVTVFVDKDGGSMPTPDFDLIFPGYKDGTFGPFNFTEDWIDPATNLPNTDAVINQPFAFNYFIRKDTFGLDTFRVEFRLTADICNYKWDYIRYFLNGDPLDPGADNRFVNLTFTE